MNFILVIFTILMQIAIGAVVVLALLFAPYASFQTSSGFKRLLITLFAIVLVALIASFFHLGSPLKAPNALLNLGHAWLSREILMSVVFFVFIFVAFIVALRGKSCKIILWITAIIGILDLICMAMSYSSNSVVAWRGGATFVAFVGTSILLGGLVLLLLSVVLLKEIDRTKLTLPLSITLIIGFFCTLAAYPIQLISIDVTQVAGLASISSFAGGNSGQILIRIGSELAGCVLATYFLLKQKSGHIMIGILCTAVALVLVSEVVGRNLFYISALSFPEIFSFI